MLTATVKTRNRNKKNKKAKKDERENAGQSWMYPFPYHQPCIIHITHSILLSIYFRSTLGLLSVVYTLVPTEALLNIY